jgi:hypothetical protein
VLMGLSAPTVIAAFLLAAAASVVTACNRLFREAAHV